MKKVILISIIALATMAVVVWARPKAEKPDQMQKQTRFLMDTYVTIEIPGDAGVAKVIEKALDRIEDVDHKFNVLNQESPLYRFNHENVPITDPEIIGLIQIALEVSKESGGAFDITVYPLVDLWGFFRGAPAVPAQSDIAASLKKVGWWKLRIENGTLTKRDKSVEVDLGGIAKGYAVGEALKVLKDAGITSALIDAGGDIYAVGQLHGKPWKVGIRNPRGEGVMGVVDVSDLTVVTSGDYERYFEKDGVRYHHILNPETGYPANGLVSVTVICSDAVRADGLSTALFVMGAQRGMELATRLPGVDVMMVTSEGKVLCSPGLQGNMTVAKVQGTANPFDSIDK
jgi:thiamine biosynthesis lipoprotein